jgi:hypothetical protein
MAFLLKVCVEFVLAWKRMKAVEAFDAPPANAAAKRYRQIALCSFLAASVLFLTAALLDTVANARPVGNVFGFSGIACIEICVICGLRYAAVNARAP